jgi:hypothetical protein
VKKNLRVNTGDQLTSLLKLVAEASVQEVLSEISDERRVQVVKSDELEDFRAPEESASDEGKDLEDDVEEAEDEEEEGSEKKPKKDLTKLGSADPTPEEASTPDAEAVVGAGLPDVIKHLNKIRSGKSLKDQETKRALNDYIEGMAEGERQSLFVFLDGLSQIMAGGVSGDEAPDPGKVGITVNAKTKIAEPKNSKKQRMTPARAAASGSEPAGEASPIIVGEIADKSKVRSIARRLMKRS